MNYYIKQRLFNIWRSSFFIMTESGDDCYEVKSNFSLLKRLTIYDLNSNPLITIKKKYFRFLPRYDICSPEGKLLLTVKAKMSLFKRKSKIVSNVENLEDMKIEGNVFAWNFLIKQEDKILVEISKKIFKIADSYCVSISDDKNTLLYLAIIIVLDCMYHTGK